MSRGRDEVARILRGEDDRLLVVVGPCSIHDPDAASTTRSGCRRVADELRRRAAASSCACTSRSRARPWAGRASSTTRTSTAASPSTRGCGWRRRLLLDLAELGLPAGSEFLDPITPQFIADLVTWGAIGARTTESQVHRELASGLSMPVGFKNGTDGGVQIAIDAIRAAAHPHRFLGVTEQGLAGIVATTGNPDCHVILRGGSTGPNYDAASVQRRSPRLRDAGLPRAPDGRRQPRQQREGPPAPAAWSRATSPARSARARRGIIGVMMESFLVDGRQDLDDPARLVYGQSITDACMGWDRTVPRAARAGRGRAGSAPTAPVAHRARRYAVTLSDSVV